MHNVCTNASDWRNRTLCWRRLSKAERSNVACLRVPFINHNRKMRSFNDVWTVSWWCWCVGVLSGELAHTIFTNDFEAKATTFGDPNN